ncbi:MAG: hypothetical protein MRY76_10855, partial [Pseudomonadales bacterium]|nr:hypothetical protein [Pseudomonadales bacterium]
MTEFRANRSITLLAGIANLALFLILGTAETPNLNSFMAATMLFFYIHLIVLAVLMGEDKRNRIYAQLPVNSNQIFWAGWCYVLLWLLAQILVWLLFAMVYQASFTGDSLLTCFAVGLGMAVLIAIISIGIDLMNFRPAWVLWLYVTGVALGLLLAIRSGISVGSISGEDEIRLFPFALLANDSSIEPLAWLVAIIIFLALLLA